MRARKAKVRLLKIHGYPTVLVAHHDVGVRGTLLDCLQRNGFHVLEAEDWDHLFDVVRVHSRPIHLVLADVSMDAHVPILKKHRSELQVVFVKKPVDANDVLAKVRQVLGSPPSPSSIR
jgi:DNA-binding NtrC family response regulator